MSTARTYSSDLRREQAEATRERIIAALSAVLDEGGSIEGCSNREIAERAGVKEITVYRHFPSRDALLAAMWRWRNDRRGVSAGFPTTERDIAGKLPALFASFDAEPEYILATLTTASGRRMRASLDETRRQAFLDALADTGTLSDQDRRKAAAVLQLLYSAYAWASLREQWGLSGEPAADAVGWAVETLIDDLKRRGDAPLAPAKPREDP